LAKKIGYYFFKLQDKDWQWWGRIHNGKEVLHRQTKNKLKRENTKAISFSTCWVFVICLKNFKCDFLSWFDNLLWH